MTTTAQLPVTPAAGDRPVSPAAPTVRVRACGVSRPAIRILLGLLWLLDGALQLQSFMFTKGFALAIVAPSASGQPFFVAGPVEWNARVLAAHPVALNGLFASIQLALGLGFLFRRTARLAIVSSVVWAGGVWYLGEGLGGLAGGHMTALLGAPGAAALYIVLALAAWPGPRSGGPLEGRTSRIRPPRWILWIWALLWAGFAGLSMLSDGSSSRTVSNELTTNASMVPSWLATIDRGVASSVRTVGFATLVITVALELAIGLLVLRGGTLRAVAVWSGVVVALIYWAVGQSFGQLFSGQATDPSTGPLLIILGLAVLGVAGEQTRPDGQDDGHRQGRAVTAKSTASHERAEEARSEGRQRAAGATRS